MNKYPRGLIYYPNLINIKEERKLIKEIDEGIWENAFKRRVQQYGYRFEYAKRDIDPAYFFPFTYWVKELADCIYDMRFMNSYPDQVIINDYQIGQGIENHIDSEYCFGDTIAILSLGSGCMMDFTREWDETECVSLYLERGSLLSMTGEARYRWQHGIKCANGDMLDGRMVERTRRISLSFRTAIFNGHGRPYTY